MMTDKSPLVSVIIPCYNYGRYLGYALQSVLNSELQDWECIVIDDGSTDNTQDVARGYLENDRRIRYLYQSNAGLSAARNAGLNASTGKYIQLLDSDDALPPKKLLLQSQYLEEHAEADIVYSRSKYFHTDTPMRIEDQRTDHPADHHHLQRSVVGKEALGLLCKNNIMDSDAPLFRRTLAEDVGGFDISYSSYEDWQYWIRCALADASFHYWPQEGTEASIRYGHTSMMSNLRRMNENGLRLRRFLHPLLPSSLKAYNLYRILRLQVKKLLLSIQNK